jgi:hypothetical protein
MEKNGFEEVNDLVETAEEARNIDVGKAKKFARGLAEKEAGVNRMRVRGYGLENQIKEAPDIQKHREEAYADAAAHLVGRLAQKQHLVVGDLPGVVFTAHTAFPCFIVITR